ncbi:phosphate ABC transporter ATP-binding protein [Candidatus Nitrotoga sp. M5]|uniref:phosphate ABC transporter ATP-binding protein n=1 Tax=Candidatus Nitrotoga sp. M5 TaxID=2890409 RepID=UPI001EF1BE50|nr:phosphate ABC transporter ATP-binding protein [Candidatus Nitrotoga sp. M5]CAH1386352.1 Phosphate import ATP-binding protein PstB 1 [Candidatus Nitrotoga sp. M5]
MMHDTKKLWHSAVLPTSYTLSNIEQGAACCVPIPHIQVENLAVSYHGKSVLEGVSLDINKGCITALIGPSGCGKTSFLSTLNRLTDLIPGCHMQGRINIDGVDVTDHQLDVLALRRKVGMIFQKPNPFPLSIRRNIEMPLREHGLRQRSAIDERVERALRDVGLWEEVRDRLDAPALALSGGQQQRLCIARALALEPSILLMDEPCSALDPIASAVVEELIQRLRNRYTVVIVTHNLAQARRVANYAAFFWMTERVGKLIEFGRCQSLFDSPSHDLTAAYVTGVSG